MATIINFAIFVSILYFALRNPVKQMVRERHRAIKEDVETTRVRLAKAKETYEEFSAKLRAIDAEVAAVRAQSRKDGEEMKSRILTTARTISSTIVSDAKNNAQNMVADLRQELRAEFGLKIVEKAEALVRTRLTGEDRARIRREFSSQMANVPQMEIVG